MTVVQRYSSHELVCPPLPRCWLRQHQTCNAVFFKIGRHVLVRETKFIPSGREIFAFYPLLDKYML